jgi:uncharacterized repeat protein (TIGR03803 family)
VSAQAQTESVLYTFTTPGGGEYPAAGLVFDSAGNLYGTTNDGGNSTSKGTVFKLSPTASGHWKKTELHFFGNPNDGWYPLATLTLDTSGNLYGTAVYGGNTADCRLTGPGCGIVFELSPTSSGPGKKRFSTLLQAEETDPSRLAAYSLTAPEISMAQPTTSEISWTAKRLESEAAG